MTNREKLNKMSDRELAEFTKENFAWICPLCKLKDICNENEPDNCVNAIERWFNEEVS